MVIRERLSRHGFSAFVSWRRDARKSREDLALTLGLARRALHRLLHMWLVLSFEHWRDHMAAQRSCASAKVQKVVRRVTSARAHCVLQEWRRQSADARAGRMHDAAAAAASAAAENAKRRVLAILEGETAVESVAEVEAQHAVDALTPAAGRAATAVIGGPRPESADDVPSCQSMTQSSLQTPHQGATHARACFACGAASQRLRRCSACGVAWYCGVKCQMKDWLRHRPFCAATVRARSGHTIAALQSSDGLDFDMGSSDESVVLWQAGSLSVVKAAPPASVLAVHPPSQATPDRERQGAVFSHREPCGPRNQRQTPDLRRGGGVGEASIRRDLDASPVPASSWLSSMALEDNVVVWQEESKSPVKVPRRPADATRATLSYIESPSVVASSHESALLRSAIHPRLHDTAARSEREETTENMKKQPAADASHDALQRSTGAVLVAAAGRDQNAPSSRPWSRSPSLDAPLWVGGDLVDLAGSAADTADMLRPTVPSPCVVASPVQFTRAAMTAVDSAPVRTEEEALMEQPVQPSASVASNFLPGRRLHKSLAVRPALRLGDSVGHIF